MKYLWSEKEYELTLQNCIWDQKRGAFKVLIEDVKTDLEDHYYAVLGSAYLSVEDLTLSAVIAAECFFTVVDADTEPGTYLGECVDLSEHDIQVLAPWLTF